MADAKDVFLKDAPGDEKVKEGTISKRDEGGYIATCALCGQQFVGKSKEAKGLLNDHFVSTHTTIGV